MDVTISNYAALAVRTESDDFFAITGRCKPDLLRVCHAQLGIASETTELLDWLKAFEPLKARKQERQRRTNLIEELGDLLWYVAIGSHAMGVSLPMLDEIRRERLGDCGILYGLTTCAAVEAGVKVLARASGQLADATKKALFYGQSLDVGQAAGSLVFVLAAIVQIGQAAGASIDDIAGANVAKLQTRYPQAFSETDAAVRDLSAEYDVLDGFPAAPGAEGSR